MTVRRLLAVVAWVLLVLGCSTAVWGVIRTAGTGVTTSPEIPSTTTGTVPGPGRATSSADARPRSRPSAHPPSSTPPPTASTGPTPAGPADPDEAPDGPSGDEQEEPTEVRRTWQGAAGTVVAACRGGTVVFRGAQPNSGWRVEVGSRGPEEVEVHFSGSPGGDGGDDGGGDGGRGDVEVKARCVAGEPRFSLAGD